MSQSDRSRRSWREIAMDILAETDRQRFRELALELYEVLPVERGTENQPAHAQSNPILPLGMNPWTASERIVDVAMALMRSDYASMQMLFPERGSGGELRLLAFRGFNPEAARFWEWVRADSKSTCGIALRDTRRVVAADIRSCDFMADAEDQQIYLQTGIHACQTTPLIGRAGRVVGMISTHWSTPHLPSENDFLMFDVLVQQAAGLIEQGKWDEKL